MKIEKVLKKVLSLMLLTIFILTMMPANVFAAIVFEEDYSTMTDFSDYFGWNISIEPSHAVFEKVADGVKIRQTKQTALGTDGSKNTTQDGEFIKYFETVIKSDSESGMKISSQGVKGKVKLTVDYVVNQGSEATYSESNGEGSGGSYYNLVINGYVNLRLYNSSIVATNTSSAAGNTLTNSSGVKATDLNSSNGAGDSKQFIVEIDTDADTVSITHNGTTLSGESSNSASKKAAAGALKSISVRNMERMNVGGYLLFKSIKIESDTIILDEASQKLVDAFPSSLVDDADTVTKNVTLPSHIPGIKWTTSDKSVMTNAGKISRTSASDPTEVTLSASFDVTTTSGKTVTLSVEYPLNVTGLSTRLENTATINPTAGATNTTEKWYTMPERENEKDGYPLPNDPDYISDDAFFGKWDATSNTWVKEPYFRYSNYPDMGKVEAAAKEGYYETAKTELLAYYRTLASSRITSVNSITASNIQAYKALYELMSRNAYVTNFISNYVIDMFSVGKDWSDVSINVTDRLNSAKGSYDIFTLVVASVDKYRNQAEVYSKESEYDPVIVAKVNGVEKTFTVAKDATLQGGIYADANFGSEKVLYAEEAGTWAKPEDRTKRMFIGFDVSGLKRSDTITDAKIILKARHTGSDDEKLMAAYWIGESSWLENMVCWNTFSDHMYFSCNDMNCWDWVTSNSTTVKGKVCGYHRDTEPATLASSYSYYVQHPELEAYPEKYAYTYLRQYMGLINSIGLEPDVMNQLDMSTHISGVSTDILRVINSKYMTGEVLTAYLKHLWLLTDYHVYNWFGKATNNFASFSTSAVYNICARFPEFARHDVWTEETKAENERIFDGFTFDDGMCLELSHNYHSTLLGTFSTPFSTYKQTGEAIPYSKKTTEIIHNIVISLFNQSGPYFGGFNMGDGYDPYTSYKSTFNTWYNNLFGDDPTIAYMATGGSSGWLPDKYTTNYPVGLRTYMRSDWSEKALALGITNKMVASHGHKDALSLAMFAYGKYLLTDQGYGSVQTGNTMYYMKSPQQHNVVTVNDSKDYIVNGYVISDVRTGSYNTLDTEDGKEVYFDTNDQYDFVEYSTEAYTTTQISQRSVTFLKNQKFWIVTDYHVPNDTTVSNEFAQNWHLYPGAEMTIDPDTKIIESHFVDEPNVMLVPVDPDSIDNTEIRGTWYSEKGGQISNSEKGMLYRNKTGNGVFSTVIMPMDVGEDYTITTTNLAEDSNEEVNMFSFTVKNEVTEEQSNFYYYHVNDADLQTTVSVGDYSTDANTLVVEEDTDGNVVSIYMVNGTFVNKGTSTLIKTIDGSADTIAFTITDGELDLHTKECDISVLDNCLINSSLADSVKYEITENIPYTVVGGMMTFTDVVADVDITHDPKAGNVIYDSAKNPELLEVVTGTGSGSWSGYYKATNNLATGGGIKFENVQSSPTTTGNASQVGTIRFSGILDESTENATKTISNMMVGKYAVEMTLQQNIPTHRVNSDGDISPTYSTLYLGRAAENADGSIKNSIEESFVELRLYTGQVNAIRYEETQVDFVRNDTNKLGMQTFEADKEWKLRIAMDTVARTYTVYVNDVLAVGAVEYPYNSKWSYKKVNDEKIPVSYSDTKGTFLPDFSILLMPANDVGAYVQINNIKIYEIESDEDDERIKQFNSLIDSLPSKLSAGKPSAVFGNLTVPVISNITWTSGNSDIVGTDGILKSKIIQTTPITFTASSTLADTEVTRTYYFKKLYNMNLVSSEWTLTASKSGNTVTASATSASDEASAKASLVIAGYNEMGSLCDLKVEEVNGKLENYTYTVNSEVETVKVFLLDSLNNAIPLAPSINVK